VEGKAGQVWRKRIRTIAPILVGVVVLGLAGCAWLFNQAPLAAFTLGPGSTGQAPFEVTLSALLSSDPDGDDDIESYTWDFGDGTTGSGAQVSHTYATPGTYTLVLIVEDQFGETDRTSKTVYVLPAETDGPTAVINAAPTSGTSPVTVRFDGGSSTYADGIVSTYSWDFGDGQFGSGQVVSHTYVSASARTYTATLTVRATDGRTGTATVAISVNTSGGGTTTGTNPSARFDIVDDAAAAGGPAGTTGVAPYHAQFDPEDTEVADGRSLLQIVWSFGDGLSTSTANLTGQWHTYVTSDPSEVFSVTLLAMDNEADTDSVTKTVKVYNHQPVAGFEVCNPLGGNTDADDDEQYLTRATAIAADRWDDDEDDNGIIIGDLRHTVGEIAGGKVRVFIRSLVIDESGTDDYDDYENDWFGLVVAQTGGEDAQDLLKMAEDAAAAPGSTKPKPDDYENNAFSYDPEGQSFVGRGAADDVTDDYPDWFPNQAWGIKYIYVRWESETPEEEYDYRALTDAGGWAGEPTLPAYDQDAVMWHDYDCPPDNGSVTKTITIRVVDFLGAESTFSRQITLQWGKELTDDLDA